MSLFSDVGSELGQSIRQVASATEASGMRVDKLELQWEFHSSPGLDHVRLPRNHDLILSGHNPPRYFRMKVTVLRRDNSDYRGG